MSLVQKLLIGGDVLLIGFNTLYVIGSNFLKSVVGVFSGFQYIICHWFKKNLILSTNNSLMFQYIICHWFNPLVIPAKSVVMTFQYIICHWFNRSFSFMGFYFYLVSIHYMSLVQVLLELK